ATKCGKIKLGARARNAARSDGLHAGPPGCTVAGIPARPVGGPCCENPADSMDQVFDVATFDPGL
ncbi:MAG: serine O-acetyltransferase, partial [Hyphomonadaceae bacterium]